MQLDLAARHRTSDAAVSPVIDRRQQTYSWRGCAVSQPSLHGATIHHSPSGAGIWKDILIVAVLFRARGHRAFGVPSAKSSEMHKRPVQLNRAFTEREIGNPADCPRIGEEPRESHRKCETPGSANRASIEREKGFEPSTSTLAT